MLVSKPSNFVKSYDYKDTSETNVAKLLEHLNSLSVNQRRENLVFFLDSMDSDSFDSYFLFNKKWLSIYKEDLDYISKESTKECDELEQEEQEEIQQTYDYIINQSQAYKDWMTI